MGKTRITGIDEPIVIVRMKFFSFSFQKKREIHPHYSIRYLSFTFRNDSIDPPRRFPSVSFPFPDQMTEIVIYFPFSFFFSFNNKIEARKIHHLERAIIVDKRVCRRPAPHSKNNYFNCDFPFPPPSLLFPPSFRRCQDFRNLSSMCTAHQQWGRGAGDTQLTRLETRGKPWNRWDKRENGGIQSRLNPRGRACGNIFLTRIFNFPDRFAPLKIIRALSLLPLSSYVVAPRYRFLDLDRFPKPMFPRGVVSCSER